MRERVAITLALTIAGSAFAGTYSEVESNNTLGTANGLGIFDTPGGSVIIDAHLGDSDVDWYSFTLANTSSLAVFAAFSPGSGADGILQLVTDSGDVIAFDDDTGVGFLPALQVESLAAGTYYIGFSGFGDVGIDSIDTDELADGLGHTENFGYKLAVGFTIVPAPSAMALLGMGGLMISRRRR
jgi:hypothetical protein